jgi:hypothetical protein
MTGSVTVLAGCPPTATPIRTATRTATPTITYTNVPGATDTPTSIPSDTPTASYTNTPTTAPTSPTTPQATSTSTGTPCASTFSDVLSTDYFYAGVRWLYCHGAISGYGDNTFKPYNNTTRGQMTKIVVLAYGIPNYSPAAPTFKDVPASDTFYQYIETAANSNIVSGYNCGGANEPCPGTYFRSTNLVTRGQLSKIIIVAAGWQLLNPPAPTFSDVAGNNAFYTFVETAYCRGIISGYDCGGPGEPCPGKYFRPGNNATRGQISKIVYAAILGPSCGSSTAAQGR